MYTSKQNTKEIVKMKNFEEVKGIEKKSQEERIFDLECQVSILTESKEELNQDTNIMGCLSTNLKFVKTYVAKAWMGKGQLIGQKEFKQEPSDNDMCQFAQGLQQADYYKVEKIYKLEMA
jgi:hypothetical protein